MYRCIIVDNEELARKRINHLLEKHSRQFEVVESLSDGQMLLDFLKKNDVDLVFLDIEMPGLSGIEVLKQIPANIYVIFTTAYKEFALDAFENDAFDYLLKPISQERFDKSLLKMQSKQTRVRPDWSMESSANKVEHIPVKTTKGTLFVKLDDIAYFEASEKYVEIHELDGRKHLINYSLTELENKLSGFLRIHRALMVNQSHIAEIRKYFNSRVKVILKDHNNTTLISGRTYFQAIQELSSF